MFRNITEWFTGDYYAPGKTQADFPDEGSYRNYLKELRKRDPYAPGKTQADFADYETYTSYLKKSKSKYPEEYSNDFSDVKQVSSSNKKKVHFAPSKFYAPDDNNFVRNIPVFEGKVNTTLLEKTFQEIQSSNARCDFENIFKSIKPITEKGVSQTISFLAVGNVSGILKSITKRIQEVFVKISFRNKIPRDVALTIESLIYSYLRVLKTSHSTPNIIEFIASWECNDFQKSVQTLRSNGLIGESVKIDPSRYDFNNARILVTEAGKGFPLGDALKKNLIDFTTFKSVVFQTLYTLQELYEVGIRHNDVHLWNVWLNINLSGASNFSESMFVCKAIKENGLNSTDTLRYYVIPTSGALVKLIDFDNSGIASTKYTNGTLDLDLCERVGVCNASSRSYDAFFFIRNLKKHSAALSSASENQKEIASFCSKLFSLAVKDQTLFNKINVGTSENPKLGLECCKVPGRLCKRDTSPKGRLPQSSGGGMKCETHFDLSLDEFDPFPMELFDEFRKTRTDIKKILDTSSLRSAKTETEFTKLFDPIPFYVSLDIQKTYPAAQVAWYIMNN